MGDDDAAPEPAPEEVLTILQYYRARARDSGGLSRQEVAIVLALLERVARRLVFIEQLYSDLSREFEHIRGSSTQRTPFLPPPRRLVLDRDDE